MVVFCCDGCGETLKKNKVDAHAARCRQCASVSCVDCSVSFFGDDYRAHTSCMTEAERYEGKLYKPKKRNPQEEWMDIVETCAQSAPPNLKNYFQSMTELDNIPRKEKQFHNFTSNSLNLKGNGVAIVKELWKLLQAEREKRTAIKQEQEKKQQEQKQRQKEEQQKKQEETKKQVKDDSDDDSDSDDEDAKKEKEQPKDSPASATKATSDDSVDKKRVKKLMKKALKKAPNRKMKLKSLRKQLETEMGLSKKAKKALKELLLQVPNSKKSKMLIDGKMISME